MEVGLHNIKNIIFDLGGVLLDLNMKSCVRAFYLLGLNQHIINEEQIFSYKFFSEFQNGELTVTEFYDKIREVLNNPAITDKEIASAWNQMIIDIPTQRVELLKKLNGKYNIYLFSNTNAIHAKKFEEDFYTMHGIEFKSMFKKVYYSHEIFNSKPRISSYLKVLKDARVNAKETLFIDDLEKNINAAREAGLQAFWLQPGMDITEVFVGVT